MLKVISKRKSTPIIDLKSIVDLRSSIDIKYVPKQYTVYGTKYKNGYPYFTLYKNGRWVTESAKYYVPVEDYKER